MTNLVTLIPWVIERLLQREYVLETDSEGVPINLEVGREHGAISVESMEEDLRATLLPEESYLLFALKDPHSDEDTKVALTEILGTKIGWHIADQLLGADWGKIVTLVYWQIRRFGESIGEILIRDREGISSNAGSELEDSIQINRPDALPMFTERKYARELVSLFPNMVSRGETLRLLPAVEAGPKNLATLLKEASRCFIYGHFLASLFLCRSAIETALEDRLKKGGHGKEVAEISRDKIVTLLEISQKKGLIDQVIFRQADDIRKLANPAIHGSRLPDMESCRNAFDQTREIIKHLYT